MTTLGELMGAPEDEAQTRFQCRQALEFFGSPWASDLEASANACDDAAAKCSLTDQPTFAFLRGQALVYRRLAQSIRTVGQDNASLLRQINELNQGVHNA